MAKFMVSVPDRMLKAIERLMTEWNTTRCGVISELLKRRSMEFFKERKI